METQIIEEMRTEPNQFESEQDREPVGWKRNGDRSPMLGIESYARGWPVAAGGRYAGSGTVPRLQTSIKVRRRTQLILRCEMEQRSLLTALKGAKLPELKVLAHCALHDCRGTTWLLVLDDDQLVRETLAKARRLHRSESVLLVEVSPRFGAAAHLSRSLAAAKIDVLYSYAAPVADDRLTAVFKTADDEYTMQVLQTIPDEVNAPLSPRNFSSQNEETYPALRPALGRTGQQTEVMA